MPYVEYRVVHDGDSASCAGNFIDLIVEGLAADLRRPALARAA